jgi:hypothetical protein
MLSDETRRVKRILFESDPKCSNQIIPQQKGIFIKSHQSLNGGICIKLKHFTLL